MSVHSLRLRKLKSKPVSVFYYPPTPPPPPPHPTNVYLPSEILLGQISSSRHSEHGAYSSPQY